MNSRESGLVEDRATRWARLRAEMRGGSKKFLANAKGNAEAPSSSLATAVLSAQVAANDGASTTTQTWTPTSMSGQTTPPTTHRLGQTLAVTDPAMTDPRAASDALMGVIDVAASSLPAASRPIEAAWWEEIVRLREESVGAIGATTAASAPAADTPATAVLAAATVDISLSVASPVARTRAAVAEPAPSRGGRRGRPRQQEAEAAATAAAAESMAAQLRDAEARLETTERLALGYIERQRNLITHLQNGMVNANLMLKVALAEKWTGELLVQPDLETPAWLQSLKDRSEREAKEKLHL